MELYVGLSCGVSGIYKGPNLNHLRVCFTGKIMPRPGGGGGGGGGGVGGGGGGGYSRNMVNGVCAALMGDFSAKSP